VARIALTTETADEFVQAERLLGPDAPDGVGQLLWLSERGGGYTMADTETGLVRWQADLAQPLVGRVVSDVAGCIVAGRRPGTPVPPDHHGQVTERAVSLSGSGGRCPLPPHRSSS
jgi:hypothetical protein